MICIYYDSVYVCIKCNGTMGITQVYVGRALPVYERYMDDTSYKYKIIPIGGFYMTVLMS